MEPRDGPSAGKLFEILVREHADMLVAYLRSLVRSAAAVEDLFQETVLIAWRRLPDFDHSRPFGPWLRGIAYHLVLDQHRAGALQVWSADPAVLDELERRYADLSRDAAHSFRHRAERLFSCLARLPERMRQIVEMVYGRGMILRTVAEQLTSTEEAAKKQLQRARQILADCLRAGEVAE